MDDDRIERSKKLWGDAPVGETTSSGKIEVGKIGPEYKEKVGRTVEMRERMHVDGRIQLLAYIFRGEEIPPGPWARRRKSEDG